MTFTHARHFSHLAIPGVGFPRSIFLTGDGFHEGGCGDWPHRSGASASAMDAEDQKPRPLFDLIAQLFVRH